MNAKGWRSFLELCLSAEDEKTLNELFDLFLSAEERSALETRCLLIKDLLEQKKTQREIAEDLNISIAKITRGSNALKQISPKLKQFLQDLL